MLQIVKARVEDTPVVTPLLGQLWPETEKSTEAVQVLVRRLFESPDDEILIARNEQGSIGLAAYSKFCSNWFGGDVAYLHAFVIDSKYRRQGLGSAFLNELVQYTKENGFFGVELDSGFSRVEAHSFYERNGFTMCSFLFSRKC